MACRNATESVNTDKMAVVNVEDISEVAFIFLHYDLAEYIYHVQGMQNAFILRFKFSLKTNDLVKLV
jgi:hypothetical protein